jgi:hypothetical protein
MRGNLMAKNSDQEFKGFVKAKLEDISSKLDRIDERFEEHIPVCNERFKSIENDVVVNKIGQAQIYVIPAVISFMIAALAFYLNYMKQT